MSYRNWIKYLDQTGKLQKFPHVLSASVGLYECNGRTSHAVALVGINI